MTTLRDRVTLGLMTKIRDKKIASSTKKRNLLKLVNFAKEHRRYPSEEETLRETASSSRQTALAYRKNLVYLMPQVLGGVKPLHWRVLV